MRPDDASPQPAPGTCAQWLKTKHKFCSWPTLGGSALCRHHATEDRVPCPVDPGHTVLRAQLARHVLVCTRAREAAAIATAPYVTTACNAGSDDDDDGADAAGATLWRLLPDDDAFPAALADIREVASLVLAAVATLPAVPAPAPIPDCVSAAAARLEETARDLHTTEPWDERHSAQQIGILAAMHAHGLLHSGDAAVFAELGAGRGYLLNALAVCVGPPCRLLFVERRAYRNKAERSLRRRPGIEVARARCDVADLDLEQAIATLLDGGGGLEHAPDTVIVLAKHLCGSATDMALRCAIRVRAGSCKLGGLAMAPCCHHACCWKAYVNKRFLKAHGIGRRQFSILKRLASWCVDSHGGGRAPSTAADEEDGLSRWGYPSAERARIGTAVKRFLDTGRAQWLTQQRGGPAATEASLVSYVEASITPENRLVVWRC